MLQEVLRLVFVCITIFSTNFAHAVLFMAPGADSEAFQKYKLERNQQSYAHWFLKFSTNTAQEAHTQVLEFSQRALLEKSVQQRALEWDLLRKSIELNRADREVLTLLAEKLRLKTELCRYLTIEPDMANLLENPQSAESCSPMTITIPKNLPAQLGVNEILVMDGKAFTKNQIPSRLVTGFYQWKIISDLYEDRTFTGTPEEFAKQKFPQQAWVTGNCENYKFPGKDFTFLLQSQIYFSDTCVNPGIAKERTLADWANEHKTLLWGLGILATGLAATQLKDKTLVITKP